jgi:hypothetical protein
MKSRSISLVLTDRWLNMTSSIVLGKFKSVARLISQMPENERKAWRDELDKAMEYMDQLTALERLEARLIVEVKS